jgi:hypothetical protein
MPGERRGKRVNPLLDEMVYTYPDSCWGQKACVLAQEKPILTLITYQIEYWL